MTCRYTIDIRLVDAAVVGTFGGLALGLDRGLLAFIGASAVYIVAAVVLR